MEEGRRLEVVVVLEKGCPRATVRMSLRSCVRHALVRKWILRALSQS